MANKTNIGEAILILGALYLIFTIPMEWWAIAGLLILIGFPLWSWEYITKPEQLKELVRVQIQEVKKRTQLMDTQIKLYAAQTMFYLKRRF